MAVANVLIMASFGRFRLFLSTGYENRIGFIGWGARGIAHIGVIKALLEQGIQIDRIAGTSAGAIVGALFAHGYPPDEILKIIETAGFMRHFRPAWSRMGLLSLDSLGDLFREYIPHDSFEALKIPLHVVAVDLNEGEQEVFDTGDLIRPVLASCCLPGIFEPFVIHKRQFVDGGVLNNLPVEPLEHKVDFIIGSHCNPFGMTRPITSMRGVVERSLILAVQAKTKERFSRCDLLIEPPQLADYDVRDLRRSRELFRIGYQYAKGLTVRLEKAIDA